NWCPKRGCGRRRAPRPHNRLPRRPCCRLALDRAQHVCLENTSPYRTEAKSGNSVILFHEKSRVSAWERTAIQYADARDYQCGEPEQRPSRSLGTATTAQRECLQNVSIP